jgi:hypothetical protein
VFLFYGGGIYCGRDGGPFAVRQRAQGSSDWCDWLVKMEMNLSWGNCEGRSVRGGTIGERIIEVCSLPRYIVEFGVVHRDF